MVSILSFRMIIGIPLVLCFKRLEIANLRFGRSLNARVSSIIQDGEWRWPRGRSDLVGEFIASTPHDLVPHIERNNKVTWTLNANGCYSTRSAWSALRSCAPEVGWFHMVW